MKAATLHMLDCNWPHSDCTKLLVCKDSFQQGFRYSEVLQKILHCLQVKKNRVPPSRPEDVSSRPNAHLSTVPSVRTTCHTVRTPDRPSIIRPDDVDFRPDPPLYREASVPACICLDISAALSDASQYSTKLQILSKFIYGKIAATIRTMWIPVRTRFSLRQELQFKFNRPNVCQHGPDARSTDMEIADSTSTVRTPAYHGTDPHTADMEIAC
jgi:hypothetical protein